MSGDSSLETTWEVIAATLRQRISTADWLSWFASSRLESIEGGVVRISFVNEFAESWVRGRFLDILTGSVQEALGAGVVVELVPAHGESVAPPPRETSVTITAEELRRDVTQTMAAGRQAETVNDPEPFTQTMDLNSHLLFDTFVIGEGNQLAHAAALNVAEFPGQSFNPLFLHGPTGFGKTHLLHAIGNYVAETRPTLRVAYTTTEAFVTSFIRTLQARDASKERFKQYFRGVDILLLDDVQFLGGKGSSIQEELFHTFNALHQTGRQVVLASDSEPAMIPRLEERLRSRFACGLIADIVEPDRETRVAILRKKALAHGSDVSDDVLAEISERSTANIRELEGMLTRILGYASLSGSPLTIGLARTVLDSYSSQAVGNTVTIQHIQRAVCEHFHVSHDDLIGRRRTSDITLPRQIAMYLSRMLISASSTQVGQQFGGKDHTTVLYAEKKIEGLIREDQKVYDVVDSLTRTIRSNTSGVESPR